MPTVIEISVIDLISLTSSSAEASRSIAPDSSRTEAAVDADAVSIPRNSRLDDSAGTDAGVSWASHCALTRITCVADGLRVMAIRSLSLRAKLRALDICQPMEHPARGTVRY